MENLFLDPALIIIIAAVVGFFMAYGIGANDVANAMGTSVGSKAITLKQAVIIAAIFEFLGAYFAGGEVTSTIRKGIVDPFLYTNDVNIFIIGMLSSLLAAGFWLIIASSRGSFTSNKSYYRFCTSTGFVPLCGIAFELSTNFTNHNDTVGFIVVDKKL